MERCPHCPKDVLDKLKGGTKPESTQPDEDRKGFIEGVFKRIHTLDESDILAQQKRLDDKLKGETGDEVSKAYEPVETPKRIKEVDSNSGSPPKRSKLALREDVYMLSNADEEDLHFHDPAGYLPGISVQRLGTPLMMGSDSHVADLVSGDLQGVHNFDWDISGEPLDMSLDEKEA